LTGELPEQPAEVQIDLPVTAHLPGDYIERDDVRMEAYRRLAAVTTPADVDDIRAEWEDRYGPPPAPAEALLDVARLRAACLRLGIRAVSVQKGQARLDGWHLLKSQEVRLARMVARARVLPDAVVVPLTATGDVSIAQALLRLLDAITPPGAGSAQTGPTETVQVPSAG
jgi:transcription-repair coupling factor (superfamily II helicase)